MDSEDDVLNPRGPIPVIDLFAGPGGLGEGFSSVLSPEGQRAFKIRLSVEKDPAAHRTLLLRSFYRQFPPGEAPEEYYSYVRGEIDRDALFEAHPVEAASAEEEAWCAELGQVDHAVVRERIRGALGPDPLPWVLIGGPPCQAYSIAGRSRILGEHRKKQRAEVVNGARDEGEVDPEKAFDRDHRHFLYREYLRIIADHRPAVFVMENVPGLLNSKVGGKPVIWKILRDLRGPIDALDPDERPADRRPLTYKLRKLEADGLFPADEPVDLGDFVLDASRYGVPQVRRRVLIVGVRSDYEFRGWPRPMRAVSEPVAVREAIGDLPPLRSTLSRGQDSAMERASAIRAALDEPWFAEIGRALQSGVRNAVRRLDRTAFFPSKSEAPAGERTAATAFMDWCRDERLGCTANHEARSHMASDLHRYLFAACFAKREEVSPRLRHFPRGLLPNHESARNGKAASGAFADRFRVQLAGEPATTVVSHISRDGHYYIHYDPAQCRSLTVREAARLQSFPDNYFFEGNRTEQYRQVGNAVPPLLAREVATTIHSFVVGLGSRAEGPVGTSLEMESAGAA